MNVEQWVLTLELGEQSPVPIIDHITELLEKAKQTNLQIREMEEQAHPPVPCAGAALRGLHCVAPATRGLADIGNQTSEKGIVEMSKAKKSEIRSVPAASNVSTAMLAMIDPVISKLDQFHDGTHGHALPSTADLTLRITLSNFCYNVHQQIYGGPKFSGIKASYDKAAQAWSNLCERYATRPEQMEADPDSDKFFTWYEQTGTKLEFLTTLLDQLKDVFKHVTGETWAPRPTEAVKTVVDPKRAEKMLAAKRAAMAARNEISEDSQLIQAN